VFCTLILICINFVEVFYGIYPKTDTWGENGTDADDEDTAKIAVIKETDYSPHGML